MQDRLKTLILSDVAFIACETHDEPRAIELVRKTVGELGRPLLEWSITGGLAQTIPAPAQAIVPGGKAAAVLEFIAVNTHGNEVYVLKDFAPHAKDPVIQRRLRELAHERRAVVILIDEHPLPESVRRIAAPLEIGLPDLAELETIARDTFNRIRNDSLSEISSNLKRRDFEHLVQSLRGLTAAQAENIVAAAILDDSRLSAEDLPRIVKAKRELLQASGCLEAVNIDVAADEIGGLANLKHWLELRRGGMTQRARDFGLVPPRGMLLLGVQGCGKSLCAKITAEAWRLPLLRMDPGVLYQKFVGESELRLRQALAQAEAMSPAILWIDEIEKAFASAAAESADGGLSQRMFGTLLSWMQDHRSPLFIVATANNIAALPPELLRKGRFDEVFFVDLPNEAARKEIFAIHLRRRKRDAKQYPLERFAKASEGFSGAEIEQAINAALYVAFHGDTQLTSDHVIDALHSTRPLSTLMAERIRDLRAWAAGRCVAAD